MENLSASPWDMGRNPEDNKKHLQTVFKNRLQSTSLFLFFGKMDNTGDKQAELNGRCQVLQKGGGQEQKGRWQGKGRAGSAPSGKPAGQSTWAVGHPAKEQCLHGKEGQLFDGEGLFELASPKD